MYLFPFQLNSSMNKIMKLDVSTLHISKYQTYYTVLDIRNGLDY